jgi:hypothetical protein
VLNIICNEQTLGAFRSHEQRLVQPLRFSSRSVAAYRAGSCRVRSLGGEPDDSERPQRGRLRPFGIGVCRGPVGRNGNTDRTVAFLMASHKRPRPWPGRLCWFTRRSGRDLQRSMLLRLQDPLGRMALAASVGSGLRSQAPRRTR